MEIDYKTVGEEIRKATQDVFQTMLGVQLESCEIETEANARNAPVGVISFIGIAGEWTGTGSLVASPQTACRMASLFLMDEFTVVTEEVLDAFAELTNMIVGNIKNQLEEQLGPMAVSVPTSIFGRNFVTRTIGAGSWIVASFRWAEERLDVQLSLARHYGNSHVPGAHVYAGVVRAG